MILFCFPIQANIRMICSKIHSCIVFGLINYLIRVQNFGSMAMDTHSIRESRGGTSGLHMPEASGWVTDKERSHTLINPVGVVDMAVETIKDGLLHISRDADVILCN